MTGYYGGALLGKTACSTGYGVIIIGLLKLKKVCQNQFVVGLYDHVLVSCSKLKKIVDLIGFMIYKPFISVPIYVFNLTDIFHKKIHKY